MNYVLTSLQEKYLHAGSPGAGPGDDGEIITVGLGRLGVPAKRIKAINALTLPAVFRPGDAVMLTPQPGAHNDLLLDFVDDVDPKVRLDIRLGYAALPFVGVLLSTGRFSTVQICESKALAATGAKTLRGALDRFAAWAPKTFVILTSPAEALGAFDGAGFVEPAFRVPKVLNEIGHGAAFCAACVAGLLLGHGFSASLVRGHANAASVVQTPPEHLFSALLDGAGLELVSRTLPRVSGGGW